MPSPDRVRFFASINPSRMEGRTARMEKIFCRGASGLSAPGFPFMISLTISLVVTVDGSSGSISFPSEPIVFLVFCHFSLRGEAHCVNNHPLEPARNDS